MGASQSCCVSNEDQGQEVLQVERKEVATDDSEKLAVTALVEEPEGAPVEEPPAPVEEPPAPAAEEAPAPVAEPAEPAPAPAPAAEEPVVKPEPVAEEPAKVEPPAKDPDVEEFEIVCEKKGTSDNLGLHIIDGKQRFVVTGLNEGGMIARWNASNPDKKVKYGSTIYEVNGVSSPLKAMLEACTTSDTLNLKARRRNRFTVSVEKKKILGLDLKAGSMKVNRLTQPTATFKAEEISLQGWNNTCEEGSEIMAGDELVEVNGKTGTHQELLQHLKDCTGQYNLVFARGD